MKIGDAWSKYHVQSQLYSNRKKELIKKRDTLIQSGMGDTEEARGVILELSGVTEQYEQARNAMGQIMDYAANLANMENTKQQAEAAKEYGDELAKILEVARRISKGGKVPPYDEKKLMEFSSEMYQAAKNAAMLHEMEEEEYDSLWEEEEEPDDGKKRDLKKEISEKELSIELPESGDVTIEAAAAE